VPRHAASTGLASRSAPGCGLRVRRSCDARGPQARFDYKARKRWELEQAQKKAMSLHHRQMERATNRRACRMMAPPLISPFSPLQRGSYILVPYSEQYNRGCG